MTKLDSEKTSPGQASGGWYFHSKMVECILDAAGKGMALVRLSLDLGITEKDWQIRDGGLVLDEESNLCLDLAVLERVQKAGSKIFCHNGSALEPVEVRADGYYKLVPTDSLPTLEINGVKMHRSKDIDPAEGRPGQDRPGGSVRGYCAGHLRWPGVFCDFRRKGGGGPGGVCREELRGPCHPGKKSLAAARGIPLAGPRGHGPDPDWRTGTLANELRSLKTAVLMQSFMTRPDLPRPRGIFTAGRFTAIWPGC